MNSVMNSIIILPRFGLCLSNLIKQLIKKNSLLPIRTLLTGGDTTLKGHPRHRVG